MIFAFISTRFLVSAANSRLCNNQNDDEVDTRYDDDAHANDDDDYVNDATNEDDDSDDDNNHDSNKILTLMPLIRMTTVNCHLLWLPSWADCSNSWIFLVILSVFLTTSS